MVTALYTEKGGEFNNPAIPPTSYSPGPDWNQNLAGLPFTSCDCQVNRPRGKQRHLCLEMAEFPWPVNPLGVTLTGLCWALTNESSVSASGLTPCSSNCTPEFNQFLGAYFCVLHTAVEHKEPCGFCDLLLLLTALSLMLLPLSRSFHPIVLSRAAFTFLKDTARDADMIHVFHKVFCSFSTSQKTIRCLSSPSS